jgi:hypothetical protein
MQVRYTLFQLMCESKEDNAFKDILDRLLSVEVAGPLKLESYTIYGKSGFKQKMEYVKDAFFPFSQVGSIHCKLLNTQTGNKVSVIVFSNKKIKISGGLSNVAKKHNEYLKQMITCVGAYFAITVQNDRLSLINGQFKISMTPTIFRKFLFTLQESKLFHSIREPALSGRGRISCAKVYPFDGRRGHFQVDPRGTVQVFGFKSFDELDASVDLFLTMGIST